MRKTICLFAILFVSGCSEEVWDPVTFNCVSSGEETANPGQEVLFHFANGYLFLQNDKGGADNVCDQAGTIECSVKMTRNELTLRQSVETSYCGYRSATRTNLDIDRETGAFRLLQEGCDPHEDVVVSGTCYSIADTSD